MAQQNFAGFPGGHAASVNPNELFGYNNGQHGSIPFSGGTGAFDDDELADSLTMNGPGIPGPEYNNMNDMNMNNFVQPGMYQQPQGGQAIPDQSHIAGYSNTPDGDPIQSPFVQGFAQIPFARQGFGNGMAYSPGHGMDGEGEASYLNSKRPSLSRQMQRKPSNTRGPLTPKTAIGGLSLGSESSPGFSPQPIRTTGLGHHDKAHSGAGWAHTPNSIGGSFSPSGYTSPLQNGIHGAQINDLLMKGGVSMPAKLGGGAPSAVASQEAKRKRRRESHNLVERRRRDNINERIQDLSRLVPTHRLEDEKMRKMIQNGTSISPTLSGIGGTGTPGDPKAATSGLAGPGARRATSGGAGSITTGLPLEDKDKGPNKGDILNGAVSWTRDLMWMLHLKLQQQEELVNTIMELGGRAPFEPTEDEKRMQTELLDALGKSESDTFSYSRTDGSGLRVPHHTDYRGDPIDPAAVGGANASATGHGLVVGGHSGPGISPGGDGFDLVRDHNAYYNDDDDDGLPDFKEEDELMDLAS